MVFKSYAVWRFYKWGNWDFLVLLSLEIETYTSIYFGYMFQKTIEKLDIEKSQAD